MKPEQLLGKRIRELRKSQNLTIERLAELTEINDKYLGSVERGEQNPSFKVLTKIAKALSVEITALFNNEHIDLSEKTLRSKIEGLLKKTNPDQLQTIFKIIRSIVQ